MASKIKFTPHPIVVGSPKEAVLFSYVHVFEKSAPNEDSEPTYNVQIIIPKSYKKQIAKLESVIDEAIEDLKDKMEPTKRQMREMHKPLNDGDDEDWHEKGRREEIEDCYFFSAKSYNRKPQVIAADGETELVDKEEFDSGHFGRASVVCKAFESSGKVGVSFFLNNIQRFNVEPLPLAGSAPSAKAEFDEVDDEEVFYDGDELDALESKYGF